MTTAQAIDGVKMLLDEIGVEYYSPIEILLALEQSQIMLSRQYISQGRKYFVQGLLLYDTLITGNGATGINVVAQINSIPMYFDSCKLKYDVGEATPRHHARYSHPQEFEYYAMQRPGTTNRAGRLEYAYSGGLLFHNGAGTDCLVTLYVEPALPDENTPLLLAEQVHKVIVDKAANILYSKEVGLPDHSVVGTNADIRGQMMAAMQQQAPAKESNGDIQ